MSRVIRGDGARPGSKVVAHEVVDARERAKELVDQAQAEAERLVAQAQREADALRETARREGAETGRAEAAAVLARAHERRAALLAASDWTQVADAPVESSAWAAYRQALRDIPDQPGFPENINWPAKPE